MIPTHLDFIRTLQPWPKFAEGYWWEDPARPDLGCFGTGYNSWGVQTNQKYIGALAVLAAEPDLDEQAVGLSREHLLERTLRALRYSLASHVSGDHHCSDGTQWGHTWISALGIERMMHGVEAIAQHLTDEDRVALRRMLSSEADALLDLPITGTKWNVDGGNRPESNIWNGALLHRVALMYPDEPHVPEWVERGTHFLLNGISIEGDAEDETIIAGRPLREWHVGPNFFEHYALDHHGYLNVGYMVICLSNIAMMHFACESAGWEPPEGLYHHGRDLWVLVKRLIFADGRLCRIGGDSRQRYCYCQDYLLPSLLFAAQHFGDAHAQQLEAGALALIRTEQAITGDGSFLSRRLGSIRRANPYYYTRLESDKAVVLAMNAYWRRVLSIPDPAPASDLEDSVRGGWIEPDHGAVMHRSARRIASWSWRARQRPQGLCLPPSNGHLAEWDYNLAGSVRLLGANGIPELIRHDQALFKGGFITWGAMDDRAGAVLPEGWTPPVPIEHQYAVAALPDDRTMIVLECCQAPFRCWLREVKGLKLNVPNDIFNGLERTYAGAAGPMVIRAEGADVIDLRSGWVCVEDTVGVAGIYGAESFALFQAGRRRASGYGQSLYYDELCSPSAVGMIETNPGDTVLDCGSVVLSGVDAAETAEVAAAVERIRAEHDLVRAVRVPGADGQAWLLVANFAGEATSTRVPVAGASAQDAVSGATHEIGEGALALDLGAGEARLLRLG
ncbi:MAG: hypothetical protein AB7Y46_04235 [Armatimonadota bacterium]